MCESGIQNGIRSFASGFTDLPDPDSGVGSSGCDESTIRAEGNRRLIFGGLRKGIKALTGRDVPQLNRSIAACCRQKFSIRRKAEAINRVIVSVKGLQLLSISDVPGYGVAIIAGRSQDISVGTELGRIDRVAMPLNDSVS